MLCKARTTVHIFAAHKIFFKIQLGTRVSEKNSDLRFLGSQPTTPPQARKEQSNLTWNPESGWGPLWHLHLANGLRRQQAGLGKNVKAVHSTRKASTCGFRFLIVCFSTGNKPYSASPPQCIPSLSPFYFYLEIRSQ